MTDIKVEVKHYNCPRCKCHRLPENFLNAKGRKLKTCLVCRDMQKKNNCEHNRRRNRCKDCGGSSICEHNRQRSTCKDCGGSSICEHNRRRSNCKDCGGASICEHNRLRSTCKECDPIGYLSSIVRRRTRGALKSKKTKRTMEYIACTIEEFKNHIESKFTEGMTWENQGKWHIDHIIPLKYNNPTLEETIERLHWTNTQPLWGSENISKGNRYIG